VIETPCGNCDRPSDERLCETCSTQLRRQLRGVPELVEQLYVSYTKQDRFSGAGSHRGKPAEAPLPVRLNFQWVIDRLGNELTTWARDLVEFGELHHEPAPPRRRPHNTSKEAGNLRQGEFGRGAGTAVFPVTSPRLDVAVYAARWLGEHLALLRRHPAALEAYRALTGAIARATMAMDRPEAQPFIGYCERCRGALYADQRRSGTTCERCGVYYSDVAERWDMALLTLRGYPATAAQLAGAIGELYGVTINRKTIQTWHHRGDIRPVDDDPHTGYPRFRVGDVLDRAERSKRRQLHTRP